MVWGVALGAAIRTAAAAVAKTAPKVVKSPYGKVGIIGGSIGWAGLGIGSATKEAQESVERGGAGLAVIAGLGLAALLVLFLLFRRR